MRRGFLITLGVIVILAVVIFMWWLPAFRETELQNQIAAIEAMENLTARKEAALIFLFENQQADREVLLRALDAAGDEFRNNDDKTPLIDMYQGIYDQGLTPWLRYRVIARLDRALMETGTPENVARAEALAREMLEVKDSPMEPYHWIVYFHQQSDLANPELTVRVALAAENATDREEYGMWPQMLDMAYSRLVRSVYEQQGLDAAISKVEVLKGQTDNPSALAALNAALYTVAVDEDTEAAVAAAKAITELNGLTETEPLNRIAYNLAERGLAPDVAIALSEQALALAPSRYDSTMVLDTVGWAHYAAGDYAKAAGYLKTAVGLMDETLTYENETVQHLLMAYDSSGMNDEAIELLAMIVAHSVDADDPARAMLAARLTKRDGDASAMEALVTGLRYEGVETAPGFTLPDANGNMVTLDGLKGDVLVLCFWSYG